MNKLLLVIKREYFIRVKNKKFILTTLLTPIAFGLLMLLSGYFSAKGGQSHKKVLVKDESQIFSEAKIEKYKHDYEFSAAPLNRLKEDYKKEGHDLLVHIPPFQDVKDVKHKIEYYSIEKLSLSTISDIERNIESSFKEYKIAQSGVDRDILNSFKMDINMENGAIGELTEDGKEQDNTSSKLSTVIGTVLGGIMGFIMYMVIFIYGSMVMRSVMEEKINRIVEVIISSVKPTTLMLGKILGVGGVGLTQLALWLILIPLISIGVSMALGISTDPDQMQQIVNQTGGLPTEQLNEINPANILRELGQMNWLFIIPSFVIFFFGGYFIYSSLFAAVGAAMGDDMGEGQQLMLPIMIPVIVAFMMLPGTLENPNGGMALFGSLFPLTSPIIMPSRLAFDPPVWQLLLSILFLVLACWFFAWFAGRIYRVGILMYGKKVNFKEIGKWIRYKA